MGRVTSDLPVHNSKPERDKLTGRTQHQNGPVRWQPNVPTGRITNAVGQEEHEGLSTVGTGLFMCLLVVANTRVCSL